MSPSLPLNDNESYDFGEKAGPVLKVVKDGAINQLGITIRKYQSGGDVIENDIHMISLVILTRDNIDEVIASYPEDLRCHFEEKLAHYRWCSESYLKIFGDESARAVESYQMRK